MKFYVPVKTPSKQKATLGILLYIYIYIYVYIYIYKIHFYSRTVMQTHRYRNLMETYLQNLEL